MGILFPEADESTNVPVLIFRNDLKMKAICGVLLLLLFSCGFTPWPHHSGRKVASTVAEVAVIFEANEFQTMINDLYSYVVLEQRLTQLSVSAKALAFQKARLHLIDTEIQRLKQEIRNILDAKSAEAQPILGQFLAQSILHRHALERHLSDSFTTTSPPTERWIKEYERLIDTSRFKIQEKSIEHKAHILATRQLFTHNSHCSGDSISIRDKAGSRCSLK